MTSLTAAAYDAMLPALAKQFAKLEITSRTGVLVSHKLPSPPEVRGMKLVFAAMKEVPVTRSGSASKVRLLAKNGDALVEIEVKGVDGHVEINTTNLAEGGYVDIGEIPVIFE